MFQMNVRIVILMDSSLDFYTMKTAMKPLLESRNSQQHSQCPPQVSSQSTSYPPFESTMRCLMHDIIFKFYMKKSYDIHPCVSSFDILWSFLINILSSLIPVSCFYWLCSLLTFTALQYFNIQIYYRLFMHSIFMVFALFSL